MNSALSRLVPFNKKFAGRMVSETPDGMTGWKSRLTKESEDEFAAADISMIEGDVALGHLVDENTEGSVDAVAQRRARAQSKAIDVVKKQLFGIPKTCNDKSYLEIDDQKQKGACAGFTLVQCGEHNFWVASGGDVVRFSGDAMYQLAQRIDKITTDDGSTPTACAKVATEIGLVRQELHGGSAPDYQSMRPVTQAMIDDAANYKIKSVVRLRSYEHVRKFLGSGLGCVQMCSIWPAHWDKQGVNRIQSFYGPRRNDQHGGGHSYTLNGYNSLGDILLSNSWSLRWGDEGAKMLSKQAMTEIFGHKFTFCLGYSDMAVATMKSNPFRNIPYVRSSFLGA